MTYRQSTSRALSLALFAAVLGGCSDSGTEPVAPDTGDPDPETPTTIAPSGSFDLVGRGPVTQAHTSDIWVFTGQDGRDYAYTGTWGWDRLYVWDVTDPTTPIRTDSVVVDARVVNDVKVNNAATFAVITREGASDRQNGIVILDLADPAHPEIATQYTENLTGGVHNTFVDGNLVYAVHNGSRSVHILDLSDFRAPVRVGEYALPSAGRYLHDVWVEDGIAYLSYWNDGLVIVDVGNGIRGGSPASPQLVSQREYVTRVNGFPYGNTHVAFPYTNSAGNRYVFVGDEIFDQFSFSRPDSHPSGYIHVFDVTNLENPVEVAKYEVPMAGAHNVWAEDDILYVAYYNAGLRALDISGRLEGDLRLQGREIGVLETADSNAFIPGRPFTWGPQPFKGLVFASDHTSGLWIARLNRN